MISYTARRLLTAIPTALLVVALVFVLMHLIPGDVTSGLLGTKASPGAVAHLRAEFGLDKPLTAQLRAYLTGLVRGDLGTSEVRAQPVVTVLGSALPPTLILLATTMTASLTISVLAGTFAAYHRGQPWDHLIRLGTAAGTAIPSFTVAIVLIQLLALDLRVLPVAGFRGGFSGLPYFVLPTLTFTVLVTAILTRLVRGGVLEQMPREYVTAAVARGIPGRRIRAGYVRRNAMLPVVAFLGTNLGGFIGVAVVIENVFDLPGLGQLLLRSVLTRDLPVVQGVALVLAAVVIIGNVVADVVCASIDPRFRP